MRSTKLSTGPNIVRRVAITPLSLPLTQRKAAGRSAFVARASSNGTIRIGINGGSHFWRMLFVSKITDAVQG